MSLIFDDQRPLDLICMGRVAVDLYAEQIHSSLADAQTLRKYLGGCAGNIAVGTARLGLQSAMFSCVGSDEMGQFLRATLQQEKVNVDLLYESDDHLTGLVLLGINPPDRFPLLFYRHDCADMQLQPHHAKASIFSQAKALLITGTGLSTDGMRQATKAAIAMAKDCGTKVILDLDYRPVLWKLTNKGNGETRFIASDAVTQVYQQFLSGCDLIVGTEEEICIAAGHTNIDLAIKYLQSLVAVPVVMKRGEFGCHIYLPNNAKAITAKSYPVKVLNVLGAGDAFMSGILRGILRNASWQEAAKLANACGALVVTRHGCAPAIPFWQELAFFMQHYDANPDIWQSQALALLHSQLTLQQMYGSNQENIQAWPRDNLPLEINENCFCDVAINFSYLDLLKLPNKFGIKVTITEENLQQDETALQALAQNCRELDRRLMVCLEVSNFNQAKQMINAMLNNDIHPYAWQLSEMHKSITEAKLNTLFENLSYQPSLYLNNQHFSKEVA